MVVSWELISARKAVNIEPECVKLKKPLWGTADEDTEGWKKT
jgi:hypothetical protein